MSGRSPRLPIDLAFSLKEKDELTNYPQYLAKWRMAIHEAYFKASIAANMNRQRGKKHYDSKVRSAVLQPGDRILVRDLSPRRGPGKLRSFWEEDVHIVVSLPRIQASLCENGKFTSSLHEVSYWREKRERAGGKGALEKRDAPFPTAPSRVARLPEYFMYSYYIA